MTPMCVMLLKTDYNMLGKLKYQIAGEELPILNEEYAADVVITIAVPLMQKERIVKKMTEVTNGRAVITEKEQIYMAI